MATKCDTTPGIQDGGSTASVDVASSEGKSQDNIDIDLAAKFSAYCDTKTKDHFTSKACNKLVKDCFEEHYKFKKVLLTNRVDSSVFPKCKEKGKPHMVVNNTKCKKFLRHTAHEFAKMKYDDEKLSEDDKRVNDMYDDIVSKVANSTGPKRKTVKQSATGNVERLTDTKIYTGAHKLRFDETGKGRGKAGWSDETKNTGYVANYKGEGTYEDGK